MNHPIKVIAISAGKGGVGKTTIAINMAVALAKQNKKVMLFDADLGLANVDVFLGLRVKKNISHVISGECSIDEICLTGPCGIKVIPAASGISQLADLNVQETANIIRAFSTITADIDTLLIDTAAGISQQVLSFINAAQETVIILCDQLASLTDAYALVKVMSQKYQKQRFWVVSNVAKDEDRGRHLYEKLVAIVNKFLDVNLHYLGTVPYDPYMPIASRHRNAIVEEYPGAKASLAMTQMAKLMQDWVPPVCPQGHVSFFFERLLAC